jgi:8-oxo-dGTP pyrophosphatase MutT (NUDIX family)
VTEFDDLRALLEGRNPRFDAPEGVPQAAVALLIAELEQRRELLLIRRSERAGDPWSGHMALPGGRRDPRDPDLLDTAVRETAEEVGVDLRRALHLGGLDDLRPVTAPARVVVRPFVFAMRGRPDLALSEEVARVVWAPLDELARSSSTTEVFHQGALRTMPCYRIGEDVVWGMTHRILQPFVEGWSLRNVRSGS